MLIRFQIEYYTASDEVIAIAFADGRKIAMTPCANGVWVAECDAERGAEYEYVLQGTNGSTLRREEFSHSIECDTDAHIYDCWSDNPIERPYYSTLFQQCIFRRQTLPAVAYTAQNPISVEVAAPALMKDEALAIVGESEALGGWCVERAVEMTPLAYAVWSVSLPAEVASTEYKFVVVDAATHSFKRYEQGENRRFPADNFPCVQVKGLRLRDAMRWRGAGVAIPVFSLRSKHSWGSGDFGDLRLMVDWAAATGMSVIQLLPVNDTTKDGSYSDSYPYNAISSFALHPLYLSPNDAVELCAKMTDTATAKSLRELKRKFSQRGRRLNAKAAVDYEAVMALKTEFLHQVYELCGQSIISAESFARFFDESRSWLLPYMVYCALRDKYATVEFSRWGELSSYDEEAVKEYIEKNRVHTYFYAFVQYLLDEQLRAANAYAHDAGVALKGDIPIGVAPFSVDVWCAPELYNCTMSAGAPPDAFSEDGQNWGFPTYNWSRMAEDGYAWWCARLRKMERYFDAYRIDHILGFFRIWEVPRGAKSAVLGHFNPSLPYSVEEIVSFGFDFDVERDVATDMLSTDVLFLEDSYAAGRYFPRIEGFRTAKFEALEPAQQQAYMRLYEEFYYNRHNDLWRKNAIKRLRVLSAASRMLTCGEDLGMIPACVAEVMESERILSLEIERMPKQFGLAFGEVSAYPYFSVAATSTHDMSTIRGWWREDACLTQRYWTEVLARAAEADADCSGDVASEILTRQMRSNSILAILPLQDWLAEDEDIRAEDVDAERINIPADPNHYWRYRMHITLEELLSAEKTNEAITRLVHLRME
ncbi:MAG: 4-alpha-glucanotransferase [Alistipes sp.]|nr:4-alpha-glucanotransferase [Alistipes sp.]